MYRLLDHFRCDPQALALPPTPDLVAERAAGRPPLRSGRYRGLPVWFHEATPDPHAALPPGCVHDDAGRAFLPDDAIASIQFELYVRGEAPRVDSERGLRRLYYLLKPFLPRAAQLAAQRLNARKRLRTVRFPSWPQDSTLMDLMHAFLAAAMARAGVEALPFVGFWPHGKTWAWCLTHDVDTALGYQHVEALARVEESRDVRSVWFFVPERYTWDAARFTDLRERGHEVGVHGLNHSGKLFSSRAEFEARRDHINAYIRDWNVRGFRSPATYRNPYWLPELDVDYDSSFLDNATLEPQRGGVTAPFPFMLNERLVELPITLPMDHTLLNVLRQDACEACVAKAAWIRSHHGLALALFHPDYNTTTARQDRYGDLLDHLCAADDAWYARPAEVADWWQRRRASHVIGRDGAARIEGPAREDGSVWWAYREGDTVTLVPAGATPGEGRHAEAGNARSTPAPAVSPARRAAGDSGTADHDTNQDIDAHEPPETPA